MKKLILLMLVLLLGAFAMFSCTDDNGDQGGEQGGEQGGSGSGEGTAPDVDNILGGNGEYIDPDGWTEIK